MKDRPFFIAHQDAMMRSLRFLLRKPWSTMITVLVIAVTLMLTSLFWMVTTQMSQLQHYWQRSGHMSLYLVSDLSKDNQQRLLAQIRSVKGVGTAALTTPEEGMALLSKQDGMQDMMRYLPDNPLPAVIDVIPDATLNTPEAIDELFQSLKGFSEVQEAKLDLDWIGRLYSVISFMTKLVGFLMMLLVATVMLVIGNTLRLIIYHRQDEIQVLQLLGASDAFIMRPLLYSGIWYGFAAACVAIVLADVFIITLRSGVNQWAQSYLMHFSVPMMPFSVAFGLILVASLSGWLSACVTVKRHL